MIRPMLYAEDQQLQTDFEPADIPRVLADETSILWLDLENPTPDDLQLLASEFHFHPLAMRKIERYQRPKVEQYDDVVYVIFYDVSYDEEAQRIDERKLDIFFGSNFLVTIHREPIAEIAEVATQWRRNADLIERGTGVLVYSLFETIIDHYFHITDRIAAQIEAMEARILRDLDQASLESIFALKRELVTLHRVMSLERDVMAMLARRDLQLGGEAATIYFQDLYDHILRFTELIESYRELLSGVLEEYLSMFANKLAMNANDMAQASGNLNHVMKVLTSYSIILGVVTMISSIYGMNFVNMPELHARYGYFVVLGVMAAIALSLGIFFKRKTWL